MKQTMAPHQVEETVLSLIGPFMKKKKIVVIYVSEILPPSKEF